MIEATGCWLQQYKKRYNIGRTQHQQQQQHQTTTIQPDAWSRWRWKWRRRTTTTRTLTQKRTKRCCESAAKPYAYKTQTHTQKTFEESMEKQNTTTYKRATYILYMYMQMFVEKWTHLYVSERSYGSVRSWACRFYFSGFGWLLFFVSSPSLFSVPFVVIMLRARFCFGAPVLRADFRVVFSSLVWVGATAQSDSMGGFEAEIDWHINCW